jgi:hypothetical protein
MSRAACTTSAFLVGLLLVGCSSGGGSAPGPSNQAKDQWSTSDNTSGQFQTGSQTKGAYEIKGKKRANFGASAVANNGFAQDDTPVEVDWPVTKDEFASLKEGMPLEAAGKVLGFESLRYTPASATSKFQLVCKQGAARVTLTFTGVKLTDISAQGLK